MGCKCFSNTDCEYYPCHHLSDGSAFNCLFCYCPLYALGKDCGGHFRFLPDGVKDCSLCNLPHRGDDGWKFVQSRIGTLIARTRDVKEGEQQQPSPDKPKNRC